MSEDESKPVKLTEAPAGYVDWLGDIKTQIHEAQQRAAQALNLELVSLYWRIGRAILDQQDLQGWGAKVIERLALDLRTNFPEMKGFSPRNLKYMRAFAEAWPDHGIVQQGIGQLESAPIVQAPLHKLPWYHHIALLDKLKTREEREWYLRKALEHNWSRTIMTFLTIPHERNRIRPLRLLFAGSWPAICDCSTVRPHSPRSVLTSAAEYTIFV